MKKPKLLSDIDSFVIGKLEQAGKVEGNIEGALNKTKEKICSHCQGNLAVVYPIVKMKVKDKLVQLHECRQCKEREYLDDDSSLL